MTLTDLHTAAIDYIAADPQGHIAHILRASGGDAGAVVARAEAALDEIAERERAAGYVGSRDELAAAAFASGRAVSAAARERVYQDRLARLGSVRPAVASTAEADLANMQQRLAVMESAMRALAAEAERKLRTP